MYPWNHEDFASKTDRWHVIRTAYSQAFFCLFLAWLFAVFVVVFVVLFVCCLFGEKEKEYPKQE